MKNIILSLIWVAVAGVPALDAQQASPSQTTATQQTAKPKPAGTRVLPQPRVQSTQATTANNNRWADKRIANNSGHVKPTVNDLGHRKPSDNNTSNGNKIVTNDGRGKTSNN